MKITRPQLNNIFQQPATKVLLFGILLAMIWIGYFTWRPPQLLLGVNHVEHLNPQSNTVAMTFDDAPHPLTTPLLLESLKRSDVKATFFSVGDNLQMYPQLAFDIAHQGHKLANHSQVGRRNKLVPPTRRRPGLARVTIHVSSQYHAGLVEQ